MTTRISPGSLCGCCGQVSSRTAASFKPIDSQFTVDAGGVESRTRGWHLSYCDSCHVLSVDPLPSENELNKIYEGDFYSSNIYRGGIGDWMMQKPLDTQKNEELSSWKKWKRARMGKRDLARVRKMAEPLKVSPQRIRFLDIGCEHLREPPRLIAWAEGKLVPGSILRIQVPNDLAGYRMRWFSKIWWMFPPIHLHYFTPASMSALLERYGFSIVSKGDIRESVGIDTRRSVSWSSGLRARVDTLATSSGVGSLPLELVRLLWDRILSVPLQVVIGTTMRGFVFWVSVQKLERASE
jgi:hypothetical protein